MGKNLTQKRAESPNPVIYKQHALKTNNSMPQLSKIREQKFLFSKNSEKPTRVICFCVCLCFTGNFRAGFPINDFNG
jgi:hypothetical protein